MSIFNIEGRNYVVGQCVALIVPGDFIEYPKKVVYTRRLYFVVSVDETFGRVTIRQLGKCDMYPSNLHPFSLTFTEFTDRANLPTTELIH